MKRIALLLLPCSLLAACAPEPSSSPSETMTDMEMYQVSRIENAEISVYTFDKNYQGHCVPITDSFDSSYLVQLYEEVTKEVSFSTPADTIPGPLIPTDGYALWFNLPKEGFSLSVFYDESSSTSTYDLSSIYVDDVMSSSHVRGSGKGEGNLLFIYLEHLYQEGANDKNAIKTAPPFLPRDFEYINI